MHPDDFESLPPAVRRKVGLPRPMTTFNQINYITSHHTVTALHSPSLTSSTLPPPPPDDSLVIALLSGSGVAR